MENKTIQRSLAIEVEILLGIKQAQTELKSELSISHEDVVMQSRACLDLRKWQIAGIEKAMSSIDANGGVSHSNVKVLVASWDSSTSSV